MPLVDPEHLIATSSNQSNVSLKAIPSPAVSPIPEISPGGQDSVSAMCQQLSRGLSLLSSSDDFGPMPSQAAASSVAKQLFTSTASSPPGTRLNRENDRLYYELRSDKESCC